MKEEQTEKLEDKFSCCATNVLVSRWKMKEELKKILVEIERNIIGSQFDPVLLYSKLKTGGYFTSDEIGLIETQADANQKSVVIIAYANFILT